jgi:hypothetical protein
MYEKIIVLQVGYLQEVNRDVQSRNIKVAVRHFVFRRLEPFPDDSIT